MRLTVDIIEDFIDSIALVGPVVSFSDDGTNTTIQIVKTYHARPRMSIDIDGTDYVIDSVINNTSITVRGVIADPKIYLLPNPFYFHGTPIMTNANHISGAKSSDKVPMIYLYEILRERDLRLNSSINRESDVRFFFLDSANFGEWETDDHYSKRLAGLNNLVDEFIKAGRSFPCFYLFETDFTRINHVNFGIYQDNKGHVRKIFDDDLTGVELSFTLPLKDCIN